MINIAIVDDEEEVRSSIKTCLLELTSQEGIEFNISTFVSGDSFLTDFSPVYDIILMDIDMPGADGLETSKKIRELDESVILIFVTNMAQYAIWGYEVDAFDFILKPVNKYSFFNKLKRAVNRIPNRIEDFISVKSDKEIQRVQISTIKYLEVNKHYVIYHTTTGDYTEYTTLKDALSRIHKDYFLMANRSFWVNPYYVTAVSKDYVTIGIDRIDISRPQKKAFMASMAEYLGGSI